MYFKTSKLSGAYLIELDEKRDERGFFARTWCRDEFNHHGLNSELMQCSISYNESKGTLRGMHYQDTPYEETKIVTCIKGAIYDVIVDLRKDSPTYKQWEGFELSENNRNMLYVPQGFAHGFQTLKDQTIVQYFIDEAYHPEYARGVRFDDPSLNIVWPLSCQTHLLSQRDRCFKDLE